MQKPLDKQSKILQYFQKIDSLTLSNKIYQRCVNDLCEWQLRNDTVQDDLTTKLLFVKEPKEITAHIISKERLTIAGIAEVSYLLSTFTEIKFEAKHIDGMEVEANETILQLQGMAAEILAYERTVLNILQRMSGIATVTASIVSSIDRLALQTKPLIASTRKTPWTLLDKKAVALGGGGTHRLNLSNGVLVKDNHLLIVGQMYKLKKEDELVVKTLEILSKTNKELLIEIEVEKPESIEALIRAYNMTKVGTLCIMMDNFTPEEAKQTLDKLKEKYDLSEIIFEAAGRITKENVSKWAQTGVDVISLGVLTHSVRAVDISLEAV